MQQTAQTAGPEFDVMINSAIESDKDMIIMNQLGQFAHAMRAINETVAEAIALLDADEVLASRGRLESILEWVRRATGPRRTSMH